MKSDSRTINSLRNVVVNIGSQLIIIIVNFFVRTIFVKTLSIDYLGLNGLFTNIISILSLTELGIGTAITYSLYEPVARRDKLQVKKILNFYKKIYITVGIVILILGACLTPFLDFFIKDVPKINENLGVIYLLFLFATSVSYFYSHKFVLLFVCQKDYITKIVFTIEKILEGIVQILILLITQNYILFLIAKIVLIILQNIILTQKINRLFPYLTNQNIPSLSNSEKKEIFANTKYLFIIRISGILVNSIDNILISMLVGIETVGFYSNYVILIAVLRNLGGRIFEGLRASVGNINVEEENLEKKYEMFLNVNFLNSYVYIIYTIGIIITINNIIDFWLGKEFILSDAVVLVLATNFYIQGLQETVAIYKETLGLFSKMAYILIYTAVINLALSILLGRYYGLFGILFATTIARLLTNAWYEPYVICKYGFGKKFGKYILNNLIYVMAMLITIKLTFYICSFIELKNIFHLILKIGVCFIVANITLFILMYKKKEFYFWKKKCIRIISFIHR